MSNIAMQKALEHAVEVKAADVSRVNTYVMKATQIVCNEMVKADPELNHSTAMTVAIQCTAGIVDDLQAGLSPLGPISPAALGKALAGEFGERVTTQIAKAAVNVANLKMRERQKRRDELHRQDMLRAPISGGNGGGPSYGIDLGQYAADQVKRFAIEDAKAAPVAPQPPAFIDPDADAAMVQAAGERTLASAYQSTERGPAPSAAVVAGAIERAKDAADRAALDIELSGRGRYPAPKQRKGKR